MFRCTMLNFRGVGIPLKLVIFSQLKLVLKLVIQLEGNVRSGGNPMGTHQVKYSQFIGHDLTPHGMGLVGL